ncbi:sulfotransferase family protein [Yoonia maricola]|uniref:Sulfotransferase family protein n=1 Tax=Yoonia maricola TaxID=420999 RepID=A0A2M8WQH0_9RHOB|nr:sulfotransferase family 2 domain-containing protein [Yoonia maricola]PJI93182.1 sulfotransferase family protein [Yoonia maricola]
MTGTLEWDQPTASRNHFEFVVDSKKYMYSYVRKNGCSAFKKLIHGISPFADNVEDAHVDLAFLRRHHTFDKSSDLNAFAATIFVYRDPFERLISAYTNKFVQQKGQEDIFANYKKKLWRDPNKASFKKFVLSYCRSVENRDGHIRAQCDHLLPIRYNAVFPLHELYENMKLLIDPELADKYFARATNASHAQPPSEDLCRIPALQLHDTFLKTGRVPNKADFYRDDLIAHCRKVYAKDYEMISRIQPTT